MAIAAVLSQQGVALVPKMYVESELSAGTLVAPWPGSPTLAKRFCLIKPGGGEGSQRCRCLSAGCRRRLRQVKSELVGRHLAPPMVSSLFYRALAFYARNSYQYGILLLRSHRFRPASRRPPSLVLQNIVSLFVLFCLSSLSVLRSYSRSEPRCH